MGRYWRSGRRVEPGEIQLAISARLLGRRHALLCAAGALCIWTADWCPRGFGQPSAYPPALLLRLPRPLLMSGRNSRQSDSRRARRSLRAADDRRLLAGRRRRTAGRKVAPMRADDASAALTLVSTSVVAPSLD
uniref:Uncharacterized protein n=1 Tax=Plectus sambesii TaxID=2011161 RepID=A0A914UP77_9BILA